MFVFWGSIPSYRAAEITDDDNFSSPFNLGGEREKMEPVLKHAFNLRVFFSLVFPEILIIKHLNMAKICNETHKVSGNASKTLLLMPHKLFEFPCFQPFEIASTSRSMPLPGAT